MFAKYPSFFCFQVLTVAKSLPYFILCICLVDFSFGGLLVVFAPIVKNVFGSRFYNRNYGLIFIGYGIGAFVGPKISASFYDSTGSYVVGYLGSAILAAAAVVLVFAARKLTAAMQSEKSINGFNYNTSLLTLPSILDGLGI